MDKEAAGKKNAKQPKSRGPRLLRRGAAPGCQTVRCRLGSRADQTTHRRIFQQPSSPAAHVCTYVRPRSTCKTGDSGSPLRLGPPSPSFPPRSFSCAALHGAPITWFSDGDGDYDDDDPGDREGEVRRPVDRRQCETGCWVDTHTRPYVTYGTGRARMGFGPMPSKPRLGPPIADGARFYRMETPQPKASQSCRLRGPYQFTPPHPGPSLRTRMWRRWRQQPPM